MGRFGLAFRAFFRILNDGPLAGRVEQLMSGQTASELAGALAAKSAMPATTPVAASPVPIATKPEPMRSDALNLLAVLQREARLIDFLQEPISAYSDAQIGAAVRDVHRGAAAVLARAFALKPVMESAEGSAVDVPSGADAGRVRLVGNVTSAAASRGTLRHAGWEATKIELPQWTGSTQTAKVVAPAEVEIS